MKKVLCSVGSYRHCGVARALLVIGFLTFLGASKPATAADDAITIGIVMPTTGREAKPGQYQKEGVELAIKQLNDQGGIFVKEKGKKLPKIGRASGRGSSDLAELRGLCWSSDS